MNSSWMDLVSTSITKCALRKDSLLEERRSSNTSYISADPSVSHLQCSKLKRSTADLDDSSLHSSYWSGPLVISITLFHSFINSRPNPIEEQIHMKPLLTKSINPRIQNITEDIQDLTQSTQPINYLAFSTRSSMPPKSTEDENTRGIRIAKSRLNPASPSTRLIAFEILEQPSSKAPSQFHSPSSSISQTPSESLKNEIEINVDAILLEESITLKTPSQSIMRQLTQEAEVDDDEDNLTNNQSTVFQPKNNFKNIHSCTAGTTSENIPSNTTKNQEHALIKQLLYESHTFFKPNIEVSARSAFNYHHKPIDMNHNFNYQEEQPCQSHQQQQKQSQQQQLLNSFLQSERDIEDIAHSTRTTVTAMIPELEQNSPNTCGIHFNQPNTYNLNKQNDHQQNLIFTTQNSRTSYTSQTSSNPWEIYENNINTNKINNNTDQLSSQHIYRTKSSHIPSSQALLSTTATAAAAATVTSSRNNLKTDPDEYISNRNSMHYTYQSTRPLTRQQMLENNLDMIDLDRLMKVNFQSNEASSNSAGQSSKAYASNNSNSSSSNTANPASSIINNNNSINNHFNSSYKSAIPPSSLPLHSAECIVDTKKQTAIKTSNSNSGTAALFSAPSSYSNISAILKHPISVKNRTISPHLKRSSSTVASKNKLIIQSESLHQQQGTKNLKDIQLQANNHIQLQQSQQGQLLKAILKSSPMSSSSSRGKLIQKSTPSLHKPTQHLLVASSSSTSTSQTMQQHLSQHKISPIIQPTSKLISAATTTATINTPFVQQLVHGNGLTINISGSGGNSSNSRNGSESRTNSSLSNKENYNPKTVPSPATTKNQTKQQSQNSNGNCGNPVGLAFKPSCATSVMQLPRPKSYTPQIASILRKSQSIKSSNTNVDAISMENKGKPSSMFSLQQIRGTSATSSLSASIRNRSPNSSTVPLISTTSTTGTLMNGTNMQQSRTERSRQVISYSKSSAAALQQLTTSLSSKNISNGISNANGNYNNNNGAACVPLSKRTNSGEFKKNLTSQVQVSVQGQASNIKQTPSIQTKDQIKIDLRSFEAQLYELSSSSNTNGNKCVHSQIATAAPTGSEENKKKKEGIEELNVFIKQNPEFITFMLQQYNLMHGNSKQTKHNLPSEQV